MDKTKKKTRKIPMSVKKPTSQFVAFLKSPIKERGPTMFFPYPSYVSEKKEEYGRVFYRNSAELGDYTMRFKITESTNIYNAVVNSWKAAGMKLVNEEQMIKRKRKNENPNYSEESDDDEDVDEFENDFNLLFTGAVKEELLQNTRSYQKISHFPHSYNIGRKDAMWRNISEMQEEFPDEYNFCPRTFLFPQDAEEFEEARNDPKYKGDIK